MTMSESELSICYVGRVLVFSLVYAGFEVVLGSRVFGTVSALSGISYMVAGVTLALVLSLILLRLPFKWHIRFGMIWTALFAIQEFSNLLEGFFFTTFLPTLSLFFAAVFIGAVTTFIEAVSATMLFIPKERGDSFLNRVKEYFRQRSMSSWVWRMVWSSIVYFPIYFVFGAIISPYVIPYYSNPSLGLRIPSFSVMIPLEFVRGFLYVLIMLPIMAGLKGGRMHIYCCVASLLYVGGALVPFLAGPTLPVQLRIFHGLEILADCLVYGAALIHLLGWKTS